MAVEVAVGVAVASLGGAVGDGHGGGWSDSRVDGSVMSAPRVRERYDAVVGQRWQDGGPQQELRLQKLDDGGKRGRPREAMMMP